jgi:hypothetical protein
MGNFDKLRKNGFSQRLPIVSFILYNTKYRTKAINTAIAI